MDDLKRAQSLLNDDVTLILVKGDKVIKSNKKGVAPLLELIEKNEDVSGFSCADKVVGRGASFLYAILGVSKVYARVLSMGAKAVFENHGVYYEYLNLVPFIENRNKTGVCPMEKVTENATDKYDALNKIKLKQKELKKEKQ